MASSDTLTLRALQVVGITVSGMLAGANFGYSLASIPAMQIPEISPAIAAKQWKLLYDAGRTAALSATAIGALANGYVLYRALNSWPTSSPAPRTDLLTGAMIAQFAFPVYTMLFMESGTNKRMHVFEATARKGGLQAKLDEKLVRQELSVWIRMNAIRGLIPGAAALLGLASALA